MTTRARAATLTALLVATMVIALAVLSIVAPRPVLGSDTASRIASTARVLQAGLPAGVGEEPFTLRAQSSEAVSGSPYPNLRACLEAAANTEASALNGITAMACVSYDAQRRIELL